MVDQERKISQRYLKRQLAWIAENGAENLDIDNLLGPISPLPRALIGEDMLPYKANKSSTTEYFRKRYPQLSLITEYPPPHWAPHTAILEGMFMIQTLPMVGMSCMRESTQSYLWRSTSDHTSRQVQRKFMSYSTHLDPCLKLQRIWKRNEETRMQIREKITAAHK